LEPLPDLFEIVMSQLLFLSFPLFSGWRSNGLRWQRKNLIERRFIGQERTLHHSIPRFTQSGQINLQKRGYSIIMIKTQSMTIRDSNQKEIEEDLDHGKIMEEPFGDKAVIDPTEGAFDLSDPVRIKSFFDNHCPHLLASMVPFSFGQGFFPNEFWISRQEKVEKKKVISRG
jgi:hypothetical protein